MTQQPATPDPARQQAIDRLIDDIRAARLAGKQVDDATIRESHPHLMPELAAELEKLRRIEAARRAAAAPPNPAAPTPDDHIPTALLNDLDAPPAIQVPGYSILREISRGGQAVVYLATQLSTGRKIALKLMRDGPFASERALTRFRREVQSLAALNHPNIVAIIDTGKTSDGSRYLAMNYIAGANLTDYMLDRYKKDPTDPGKLLRTFLKICDAVNAAHRLGIIHRDLKPSNIRVDERGEPHILDFGLARTALDHALPSPDHAVSVTGEFLGSLPWSSPEQAEGNPDKIDIRTDVYSLGVILYQILTAGRFPYQVVGNIRDVLNNILTAEPTPPSKIAPIATLPPSSPKNLPPHSLPIINETIEKIVLKALAKKPSLRYQSAGELGKDVARYLAGRRTASQSEAPQPAPVIAKTFPKKLLLITAAALALAIALYFLLSTRHPPSNSSSAASGSAPASAPAATRISSSTSPAQIPAALVSTLPALPPNPEPRTIDLLKLLDVSKDSISGQWTLDAQGLHSRGADFDVIEFPYQPPAEYDYKIIFGNITTGENIDVMCFIKKQFSWVMGRYYMGFSAYQATGGLTGPQHPENPTHVADELPTADEVTLILELRKNHARILIDGREIENADIDWSSFNYPRPFPQFAHPNTLGIGGRDSKLFIKSAQITEITGQGKLLRDQNVGPALPVPGAKLPDLPLVITSANPPPAQPPELPETPPKISSIPSSPPPDTAPSPAPASNPPVPTANDSTRQNLNDIFGPKALANVTVDADGIMTAERQKNLTLLGTEGKNFTISGEFNMDSDAGDKPAANGLANDGGVDFVVRVTGPGVFWRLNGKALGSVRFHQPDNQWIPFRFDVSGDGIHAVVGGVPADLKGPLRTDGLNLLRITAGAKIRKLSLTIH